LDDDPHPPPNQEAPSSRSRRPRQRGNGASLTLQRDEVRLARFGTGIRDTYATLDGSGDHVDIDLYEHEGSDVTQVSMYIADLSDVALEFEGPHLTSRE
jgi:hypothetical protein